MPLPIPIHYVDKDSTVRTDVAVKQAEKPSGYRATTEYHPTMVPVKCRECRSVGIAEFVNGFNLRDGDKLMAGKPIVGLCLRCRKETELVPILIDKPEKATGIKMLYDIRRALEEAVRRGERLGPSGMIWPLERVKLYEERLRAAQEKR